MREKVADLLFDFVPITTMESCWKRADAIHALYLAEGWVKVESSLIVTTYEADVGQYFSRPPTGEEIVEIAEATFLLKWGRTGMLTLRSGARVTLKEKS